MSVLSEMTPSGQESEWLGELSNYSACDISDTMLKLKDRVSGEAFRAGHLADILPYAPTSPFQGSINEQPKVIGFASTLKFLPREPPLQPPSADCGGIPDGQHWADLTDENSIVVIEQPEGQTCAAIGGIMASRMEFRGVKACVVAGRVRDLKELQDSGLPVWALGRSTVGAGAEAVAFSRNTTISIGGVEIAPGDIIFCDPLEGIVSIPRGLLGEVMNLLPGLVAADERVKEEIRAGKGVKEAFALHRG